MKGEKPLLFPYSMLSLQLSNSSKAFSPPGCVCMCEESFVADRAV